ncbi:MAG: ABC transporter ATP-binding protein [Bacteroidetes bacterium HGW-Bacteroidetes-1]|jgi:energy-coupling factor transporter ATP-binding protein EcfA2|nr:MAG: ABC transporter ATP-binding protein [Bacteroidetes bacterium HGW-Bacteroidetes-1]
MPFEVIIPRFEGQETIKIENGSSVVFVGANGAGKTRLAAYIEKTLSLNAHRISAHRVLSLNPDVPKISERKALFGLRTGYPGENANVEHREGNRWQNHESVALLNDFDFLVQALFAEQSNRSLVTHTNVRNGNLESVEPTKFEILVWIWERLLPNRKLHISGDDIRVSSVCADEDELYSGSEMSDGERAVFYVLGQTLVAADNSLIIFDEPELHIHRSIMAKLWDELEAVRSDCAFVFITHDLEFASSRVAEKYILREYKKTPCWNIEKVPADSGFDEELTTLILGSRRPILFVEGTNSSLDIAIYRSCFSEWSVVPKGSCEEVIHSVVTMRNNNSFTRITCSGIVDADDYSQEDIEYLRRLGISTLPVSEIENIILLPLVSKAIAEHEGLGVDELEASLDKLAESIFGTLNDKTINDVVARYCRRRIDRLLKRIDLSAANTVDEIVDKYSVETANLDIRNIAKSALAKISQALAEKNLPLLLEIYDNKGLMALAAANLKKCRLADFENWLVRVLLNNKVPNLVKAIKKALPEVKPQ